MKNETGIAGEVKKISRFFRRSGPMYILVVLDDERVLEYLTVTIQADLEKHNKKIALLALDHKAEDFSIYSRVKKYFETGVTCDGLIVTNVNSLVYRDALHAVDSLNKSRDAFERFGVPMVFVVNTAVLKKIIQGAPDFYQLRELPDYHIAGTGIFDPVESAYSAVGFSGLGDISLKAELLEENLAIAAGRGNPHEDILNSLAVPLLKIYIHMGQYTKMKALFNKHIEGRESEVVDKEALQAYFRMVNKEGLPAYPGKSVRGDSGLPAANTFDGITDPKVKKEIHDGIEARRQAMEAEEWDRAAEITFDLGDILTLHGYPQVSFDFLGELEDKDLNEKNRAVLLHRLGMLHHGFGNYDEALTQYQRTLEIKEKIGDINGASYSLHNIGIIHQCKGDYDEALKQYQGALEINEKIGNIVGAALTMAALGTLHVAQSDFETALKLFLQAHAVFAKVGSPRANQAAQDIARVREKLTEERFSAILKEFGITLPPEEN
ncbi:MAG: tetratricopeptide repeat protein [bacterium]|nr:tetratricopeptide repeat protein [bacterium]